MIGKLIKLCFSIYTLVAERLQTKLPLNHKHVDYPLQQQSHRVLSDRHSSISRWTLYGS